jgi:hypothetical protein
LPPANAWASKLEELLAYPSFYLDRAEGSQSISLKQGDLLSITEFFWGHQNKEQSKVKEPTPIPKHSVWVAHSKKRRSWEVGGSHIDLLRSLGNGELEL